MLALCACLCLCAGSLPMDTELHLFKIQQRELIRKRQSEYWRQFELRKNAKAKVTSAPNTGGAITDQAPAPSKGQSCDVIDLLTLSSDSEAETNVSAEGTSNVPKTTDLGDDASPPRKQRVRRTVARARPLNPAVPATIKSLWEEVERLYDRHQIDPPLCPHHECPYCTGALMEQRFDLMQRLVTLEKLIWLGDGVKR